jgi:hypothetical protein
MTETKVISMLISLPTIIAFIFMSPSLVTGPATPRREYLIETHIRNRPKEIIPELADRA